MNQTKLLIFFLILFTLTACSQGKGKQADSVAADESGDSIAITDFSDRTVSIPKGEKKIVALGNGELDIIYALGEKVVGRPNGVSPVKEAQEVEEIGSTHGVDLEKLTALEPDVVLGNHPMNMKDLQSIEGIGAQLVLTSANSLDDLKKQILLLSELVEKEETSKEIIQTIDDKVEELKAQQTADKPRVLLVYGAPGTNMAALPNSLSGNLVELAGGENIASDYPSLESYPQYAQLNTERIIESNPEIIMLMSHGNPEEVKKGFMKEMEQNAGWKHLDAVKNNRFIILPSDLFGTNPGTRVTDALDLLHRTFQEMD